MRFYRIPTVPHMEATRSAAHYLQTANIRTHYTESQYVYESRADCNNHLPLSVIPAAHVRWSLDDVGEA